jgi:hypothetical protein
VYSCDASEAELREFSELLLRLKYMSDVSILADPIVSYTISSYVLCPIRIVVDPDGIVCDADHYL